MARRRLGTSKDVEQLAKIARNQKWVVTHTESNHLEFRPPSKDKQIVVTSLTSSDWRSYQNLKSRLRKSGLEI